MKYYIIAGEASGDLHAANLIKEIKQESPEARFRAWGGPLMQAQGADVVKNYADLAFMGFVEVVANLPTILNNIKFCKQDITAYKPDAIVLVDYPGFNLRIAKWAKEQGYEVIYYISPQIWAWKQSRVHAIKKTVDLMLVILPFEEEFYKRFDYPVTFVGHPLLDAIEQKTYTTQAGKPYIALLPGSRKQEIEKMLPIMLSAMPYFPQFDFVVAGAPSLPESFYTPILKNSGAKIISGKTYSIIAGAQAALVTSGTATLETALLNTPEVVCYKGSWVSYQLAKRLIKVKYIALVNLILDRPVVKELIQEELNAHNLQKELDYILLDTTNRQRMLNDYAELKQKLGGPGASKRAAQTILNFLSRK
jgi:lipid-A-disaccharide synthase